MTHLVNVNDLCKGMEATLRKWLPQVVTACDLDLGAIDQWLHLPTMEAITNADYPIGAIVCPGLVQPPERKGGNRVDGAWRVVVGVWDRGDSHDDTARKVRSWGAAVRGAASLSPSLGGLATSSQWRGEEYDRIPGRDQARTLGACAVAFDVEARDVVDLTDLLGPPPEAPIVRRTVPNITIT